MTPAGITLIGDVHGQAALLAAALEDAGQASDLVIALGDYINIGPDSRQVVEVLLAARGALGDRLVLLRGNHEQSLLDYLREPSQTAFLRMGGLATIKSYHPDPPADILDVFRQRFPAEHLELLRETAMCYETPDLLASHCGYSPAQPHSRRLEDMVLGSFPAMFEHDAARPRPLVVCGHYVQDSGRPHVTHSLICLDTGAGHRRAAPLTSIDLPSREIRQYA